MIALANIREPLQEYQYHKAQSWDPSFSTFFIDGPFLSIDKSAFCNYADDNKLYTSSNNANSVINKLQQDFLKILNGSIKIL